MGPGDQRPVRVRARTRAIGPAIRVDVSAAEGQSTRGLGRWLVGVAPRRARGVVSLAIVSDARVRALNRTYRGLDRATDVLSFPTGTVGVRARIFRLGLPENPEPDPHFSR